MTEIVPASSVHNIQSPPDHGQLNSTVFLRKIRLTIFKLFYTNWYVGSSYRLNYQAMKKNNLVFSLLPHICLDGIRQKKLILLLDVLNEKSLGVGERMGVGDRSQWS